MRINSRRLAVVVVVLLAFWPLPFLLSKEDVFVFLDAVAISIGIGVIWAYFRGGLSWLGDTRTTSGHLLVLGIVATWLALGGRIVWMWTWRLMGRPEHLFDNWFVALTVYLAIIGGALHLLANRAIDGQIPPSGWATLLIVVGAGVLIGTALVIMGYGAG